MKLRLLTGRNWGFFGLCLALRTSNVGAKAIEKGIQGGGGIGFSGLEDLNGCDEVAFCHVLSA